MQQTRTEHGTLVGVFESRERAQTCVNQLEQAGFNDSQVGIVGPGSEERPSEPAPGTQHAEPKGAAAGIVPGAVAGGILGALATGLIPGIGPVIGGGILAGVIGGALAGGAVGGVTGALIGAGVPEEDAKRYESEVKAGRWLVTCKAEDRGQEAYRIINGAGGQIESPMSSAVSRATGTQPSDQTMPLREERLEVEKQPVETGEARLTKDVETEQQSVDVPVTREQVTVERHPVQPHEAQAPIGEGRDEISTPVREEDARLNKQTYVTEEVGLDKTRTQDTERVSGEVRKEVPKVEKTGDAADINDEVDRNLGE